MRPRRSLKVPHSHYLRLLRGTLATAFLVLALFGTAPLPATAAPAAGLPTAGQTISGLDAHDGMITQVGATYYLYGTRYGCGFHWGTPGTPFCGFGVWKSTDKASWTFVRYLFDPHGINSWRGESWQTTCGEVHGGGCFNARMVQRTDDGVWILWFNAPDDFRRTGANAYYALGCQGPAGPCGDAYAGGTTHKPSLYTCHDNGDFSIVNDGGTAYIVCTMADQSLSIEPLDRWWTNGTGGGLRKVGGLTNVESPAVFRSGSHLYLTYSDPNCGYGSGTGTSYGYSTSGMLGPWHVGGRLSNRSCSGQPRSLSWIDGAAAEWIDQWTPSGATNQTTAAIRLEPLKTNTAQRIEPLPC
ncbi:family 43 glycosylhydrolase [Streptomyces phyllanthi]|uniref:Family 43 glycosylhydrolase n=1 Tax=Streptomyces phyllanthi TaxID=1803180 RepID=A0A5N8VVD7_9ACTN|nr:family 43 glycosylhydrolase [Streptomyces phyllanthi]MPY38636.1 family 43 glycosylhydrolase [Streptomyces phyllanthi]